VTAAPETESSEERTPEPEPTDYASFGSRFFDVLVTSERVAAAVNAALGSEQFGFGPMPVGPGKIAKVTVTGEVGRVTARRRGKEPLRFRLTIPAEIDLLIDLTGQASRFHGNVLVGLDVTARAARPLALLFEIAPPTAEDVKVTLAADGLRANLLRNLAGIDEEVHRFVLQYVTRELESERVREACRIDVAGAVQGAWTARFGSRRGRD
jgi:hypothetical protein